jgi:hypothetical protein
MTCEDGRLYRAEEEKGSARGVGWHAETSRSTLGVVPSGRAGSALAGTCARVPVFKPTGRSLQSQYSRHRHVGVTKSDTAPTPIVVASPRAVTASGSDGPIRALAEHCRSITSENCHSTDPGALHRPFRPARHRPVSMTGVRKAATGRNGPATGMACARA